MRVIIVELRYPTAIRIGEPAEVGLHVLLIEGECVVADRAHLTLNRRTREGVTLNACGMDYFGLRSVLVAGIADRSDVVPVFPEFVLDRVAVAISAVEIIVLISDDKAFDHTLVR